MSLSAMPSRSRWSRPRCSSGAVGGFERGLVDIAPRPEPGLLQLVLHVGLEHAPGREGAGMDGDDHLADLEFLRQRHRVHRPGAAIGEEREVARVDAAADGDGADRVGHPRVDDVEDALRHRLGVERPRRRGDLRDRLLRQRQVQRHPPAGEVRRVDAAEHGVGVGDRRARSRRGRSRPGRGSSRRSSARRGYGRSRARRANRRRRR